MKPTTNRLLVKVREEKEKKEGNSVMKADVLKVGPDVVDFKEGDVVVFAPYGFDEVVVGSDKLLIVSEDLIIATHEGK